jgi:predicted HicB family RNase H-like nuclease
MLTYKGYHATVEFRPDDGLLYGRVLDLSDTVVFEVQNASDVQSAFEGAVDDYLDFCAEIGKDPEKPYSGRFNVRLPSNLHRAAAVAAEEHQESLNAFVGKAIKHEVERRGLELA